MSNWLKDKRVAVLMGGDSAEREISLKSGSNILEALQAMGVDAAAFDPKEAKALPDFGVEQLKSFDLAFIALHGMGGEDGVTQALLEYLQLPYTGSGVQASAVAMDKVATKRIWQAHSLSTPSFNILRDQEDLDRCIAAFEGVWIVKPSREGSSIGMSIVSTPNELESAYQSAHKYDADVLLERFIEGEEYTVAIVNDHVLPVIRLKTESTFYDYEAKYLSGDTQYLIPSGLTDEDEEALQALCLSAYKEIGCRGWGRVDVMRDKNGKFWLLEVNTVPGMTAKSLVPMAAAADGIGFKALVLDILSTATLDRAL